jgi:hypothetical protein
MDSRLQRLEERSDSAPKQSEITYLPLASGFVVATHVTRECSARRTTHDGFGDEHLEPVLPLSL